MSEATDVSSAVAEEASVRRRQPVSRALYGDIIQFLDFLLITLISIGVAYGYHIEVLITDYDFQIYATAGIIGATGMTAILRRDGYYDFERLISSSRSLQAIIARWAMIVLGLIAFAFALKMTEQFSRFWLFTWTGCVIIALTALRVAAAFYLRRAVRVGGVFARRIAIVGANIDTDYFISQAIETDLAVSIVGVFTPGAEETDPNVKNAVSGSIQKLVEIARRGGVDDILIAMPHLKSEEMTRLINRLAVLPVSVAILPNHQWLDHKGGEMVRVAGAPALSLYRRPLEGWGSLLKMIEDRVLGLILFLFALPLLVACAIALRIQGPGPILFRQKRHGFNNEVFNIYKFRTMTVAEDGDTVKQAVKGDQRVTPVGAFLRKWSLDELPQFLNVLKGEMSLIGPRPHALAHNHEYAQQIENYSGRHRVKPGITGWAQVNGFRGETSETEQMADRVRFDLEYIDNWSLWFDFKILVLTVAAVLFPKNAH